MPKATIVPLTQQDKDSVMSDKQESFSFEIQLKGTLRDKVYTFRTFNYHDMMIWLQLLETVASNTRPFSKPAKTNNNLTDEHANTSSYSSPRLSVSIIESQALEQESTPPPSPPTGGQKLTASSLKSLEQGEQTPVGSPSIHQYVPQLDI